MWTEELGRAKGLERAQEESGPKTFRMEGALVVSQPIFCQCKPVPLPLTCSSSLLRLPKAVPVGASTHTDGAFQSLGVRVRMRMAHTCPVSPRPFHSATSPLLGGFPGHRVLPWT